MAFSAASKRRRAETSSATTTPQRSNVAFHPQSGVSSIEALPPRNIATGIDDHVIAYSNSNLGVASSGSFNTAQEFIGAGSDGFENDDDFNDNNEQRSIDWNYTKQSEFPDHLQQASYSTMVTIDTKKGSRSSESSTNSTLQFQDPTNTTNMDRSGRDADQLHVRRCSIAQHPDDRLPASGWSRAWQTIREAPDDRYYNYPLSLWTQYPYASLQKVRLVAGYMVTNPVVQNIIVAMIIINALLLGLATCDFVYNSVRISHIFNVIDTSFLVIFTVELVFQIFYRGVSLFQDGWLTFDFIIIVMSWSLQSVQVIRAFRIFRALRLIARLKALREIITALGAVMPRMYAISVLLLLIFYIFAVLFTQLFGDLEMSGNYFSSLDASLFTCMDMMTLNWADVAREVMTHRSWAWAPFLSFISLTGFIVYNLIVAVVCDAVAVLDRKKQKLEEEKQRLEQEKEDNVNHENQLQNALHQMNVLAEQIERMKQQHVDMCLAVSLLTGELERSHQEIEALRIRLE
jgi:Ion transport protein